MPSKTKLIEDVKHLLGDLTGEDFSDIDQGVAFVDLGMDSLILTQFSLRIKNKYKMEIPFRRLLQDLESFELLVDFLLENAAPEYLPDQGLDSPPVVNISQRPITTMQFPQASDATSKAYYLISQQLSLLGQQLALLSSASKETANIETESTHLPQPSPENKPHDHEQEQRKTKSFGPQAKIKLDHHTALLSNEQKEHFDTIVKSYLDKTVSSKEFAQQHRSILADPRSVSGFSPEYKELVYPIVVNRSKGCRLWDIDGNEYIDTLCGYGSNFFGYSPDFVKDAMKQQLEEGIEIGPQHPLAGEVARLLKELIPLDRFAFCNTGSEAVLGAIRMARTATGRQKIVMFNGSYHGIFDEVIVRPGKDHKGMPAAAGIMNEAVCNSMILEYGNEESLAVIKQHKDDIAAVLVEPVQSRNPGLQPGEFLKKLRKLTEETDIALVFDEVITGFRVGPGGAQDCFGVKADIATYGKVVGAGISIGVIAGAKRYTDTLDGGFWQFGDDSAPEVGVTYFAGTFVRHPLALAAAKAALTFVQEQGKQLQDSVNEKTEQFARNMNLFFKYNHVPMFIEQFSSMMYLKFEQDLPYGELTFCDMRTQGIHIWYGRPMFFSIAHTDDDIARIQEVFMDSVLKMQSFGFLPGKEQQVLEAAEELSA